MTGGGWLLQSRYKMTMGLTPMDPNEWVEIDEYYEEEMALRRELVRDTREVVIASKPEVGSPQSHICSTASSSA